MTDSTTTHYRQRRITFHEDAGYLVIYKDKVLAAEPTLEAAKDWIDRDIAGAARLGHLIKEEQNSE